jgi:hypothetical protein
MNGLPKKFEEFCGVHGYSYPKYLEQAILHYVIQLDKEKTSIAMLGQLKPALTLLEELSGTEGTAWTSMVNVFLVSAKRRAAEDKPIVKKAGVCLMTHYSGCIPHVFKPMRKG